MKILLIGGTGFIGHNLERYWASRHVVHTTGCVRKGAIFELDVMDDVEGSGEIRRLCDEHKYDAVVYAAGAKDVDWCEQHMPDARIVNACGARNAAFASIGCQFVYISDSYVFDGHDRSSGKGNFTEKDVPAPKSVYAVTKRLGEVYALKHHPNPLIVRTSSVYGHGANILPWLRTVATPGMRVPLWHDRTISPTYVDDIARAIESLLLRKAAGTFHVAGVSQNRAQWLLRMAVNFNINTAQMESTSAPDDCRVPKNLSLWCEKLKTNEMPRSHTSNLAQWVKLEEEVSNG